ncbi:hypothetical protein CMUS01_13228 [Colletotrichum musicola]|uniref:Uncharacterized protein n=1 Tax=Colletotrichum musicola TaxID=2175873 RepID=A0A8H6MX91_9PEZI|nr:hypothetical protein CMUS01_13228 [Colletotrichum musicola]
MHILKSEAYLASTEPIIEDLKKSDILIQPRLNIDVPANRSDIGEEGSISGEDICTSPEPEDTGIVEVGEDVNYFNYADAL